MTDWHTNLIKGYVPAPAQRRAIYIGMMSFFAICGLVLVATAYYATRDIVHTVHERKKIAHLEQKFRSLYGGLDGDLTQIAHQLKTDIQQTHDQLEEVNTQVHRQINLTRVLAGVSQPLPHNVRLVRLNLYSARGIVQFDLVMPDTPVGELSHVRSLVDTWNEMPLLKEELRDIRILARQTQRVKDQSVVVLRLEGRLAVGKE